MSEAKNNSAYWEKFSSFVNEKTLRERIIILLVIVVLIYGIVDIVFLGGLLDKHARQANQLDNLLESNQMAEQEVQQLLNQINKGQLAMQRQQQLLNEKLNAVDKQLASAATGFIPATLMPKVLEQLLDKSGQLIVIKLENKPVEKITGFDEADNDGVEDAAKHANDSNAHGIKSNSDRNSKGDSKVKLYRHGVELQLQGSYLATLAYLKRLEKLQWRFEWQSLIFEVQEYPKGTVMLEVYTYSTERDWIGV